jgi:hypothetical protein
MCMTRRLENLQHSASKPLPLLATCRPSSLPRVSFVLLILLWWCTRAWARSAWARLTRTSLFLSICSVGALFSCWRPQSLTHPLTHTHSPSLSALLSRCLADKKPAGRSSPEKRLRPRLTRCCVPLRTGRVERGGRREVHTDKPLPTIGGSNVRHRRQVECRPLLTGQDVPRLANPTC